MVALLLNLRKGTIQDELDQFIDFFSDGLSSHGVSASAFYQARQKLNLRAVVDGSTVRLPATPDVP